MAQMRIADVAGRLDPGHSVTGIRMVGDDRIIDGLREAGPTRAALEFAGRIEQLRPAAAAGIAPGVNRLHISLECGRSVPLSRVT